MKYHSVTTGGGRGNARYVFEDNHTLMGVFRIAAKLNNAAYALKSVVRLVKNDFVHMKCNHWTNNESITVTKN